MKVFIENPADQTLVSVADWKKSENPFAAQFVVVMTDDATGIKIAKKRPEGSFDFNAAQAEAAKVLDAAGNPLRCPTRRECLDIYDARFQGLDEALEVIGGDSLARWFWTNESDADPECSSNSAFFFYGYIGYLSSTNKYGSNSVCPVTAFQNR